MIVKKYLNSRILVLLKSLFVIIVSFVFVCFVIANDSYVKHEKRINIEKGMRAKEIAALLKKQDVIVNAQLFYAIVHALNLYNIKMKAGEYDFEVNMSMIDVIKKIVAGKVVVHKLTIPEGYTIKQVIELIKSKKDIIDNDFTENFVNYSFSEGDLLPETYVYQKGTTVFSIVNKMNLDMRSFLDSAWEKRDRRIDSVIKNPRDAVKLASIIEAETLFDDEKPRVAGVYLNRLKKRMPLQADPTIIYAIMDQGKCFGRKLLISDYKTPSIYNTYLHRGLPPTAICNPGKSSIMAVLHPEWHSHLYFVASNSGRHMFSRSFNEHKERIKDRKLEILNDSESKDTSSDNNVEQESNNEVKN